MADLDDADVVLLLGSNVAETMPPFVQHLAGVRAKGGLVVVDPRHSPTAKLTQAGAGFHLQPVPGTDLVVLLGLLHIVIAEQRCDLEYLAARTSGFEEVAASVVTWWPERVEAVTGVPCRAVAPGRPDARGSFTATRAGWCHPHRARGRTEHAGCRHRHGRNQPGPGPRVAGAPALWVRADHRPGQRAGWPGAWAEMRSAARLPVDQRPRGPRSCRLGLGCSTGKHSGAGGSGDATARPTR